MFFEIKDDVATRQYTDFEVSDSAAEDIVDNSTDIELLDGNISTYSSPLKHSYSVSIPYITKSQFDELKAFYVRQRTTRKYPIISIPTMGVQNMTARMILNTRNVINKCGIVEGATMSFRESRQLETPPPEEG